MGKKVLRKENVKAGDGQLSSDLKGAKLWKPKTIRLGLACGFLSQTEKGISFSDRFIMHLCNESKVIVTQKLDRFLENGWSELVFAAGVKTAEGTVPVDIDEFSDLLTVGITLPLMKHLEDVAETAQIMTEDAAGGLHANEDFETELWEMAVELERPEDVRPFIVGAYAELVNARLLLYNPKKLDHCHLLALFLYVVFKDIHVAALEIVLTK